jgi:hypothetical protein
MPIIGLIIGKTGGGHFGSIDIGRHNLISIEMGSKSGQNFTLPENQKSI